MDTGNLVTPTAPDAERRPNSGTTRFVAANRHIFDAHMIAGAGLISRLDDLRRILAEAEVARADLHKMRHSASWRVTAPLRGIMGILRGMRKPTVQPAEAPPPPMDYAIWCETAEPAFKAALARALPGQVAGPCPRLGLVILAHAQAGPALAALTAALPPAWRLLVLHDQPALPGFTPAENAIYQVTPPGFTPADAVRLALRHLTVDLLGFHDARDRLAPDALSMVAAYAARQPQLDLIFADEDWVGAGGAREAPFFKPGWDPELQRGRDLIGPFALYRTSLIAAAARPAGVAWRYDLASQIAAALPPGRIQHIPAILLHRDPAARPPAAACAAAAAARLHGAGVDADVTPLPGQPDLWRVTYHLPPAPPLVTVIICTRDHATLLDSCTTGLLRQTDYPRIELLIVDNGTVELDALSLLAGLNAQRGVRVIRAPGAFNWSTLNNRAAAQAQGEILLLLNNDIEVLRPDWLSVLVAQALQPGIGAVGAKLLYPDGSVQHAGLSTDPEGVPRHLFRFAATDAPGTCEMMGVARGVWGLTGACIAMRRDVYLSVGGLNEALAIGCNDVDIGLRLAAHGYQLVWTPWAVAAHHEQATRPSDQIEAHRGRAREEINRLIRDWGNLSLHDPYLNPNLHLLDEHPALRPFPA